MTPQASRRRGLLWALVGGAILLVGIIAIVVSSLAGSPAPTPTSTNTKPAASAPFDDPTESPTDEVVDSSVVEKGWIPEPITTDAETYVRAALAAASTFDTTKSTRSEWLAYLDTWFTPDTRYSSEAEQREAMAASQLELRQGVVLPQSDWDSLANEDGRVEAETSGDVEFADVPEDPTGDMRIGTAEVVLTFTRSDGIGGGETSYDENVRVSVQVLCGGGSVPTPNSAQQAGHCKVVRFFAGSLEP